MKLLATIEMPKGCDRRIHISYDSDEFIDLGPISDKIPINDGIMPVAYGYLNDYLNTSEGDEVDVLVFSENKLGTGEQVEVTPFALFTREDKDNKVLACDNTMNIEKFEDLDIEYQRLLLDYFGYNSPIINVGGKAEAEKYLSMI